MDHMSTTPHAHRIVFILDCDNTLLDNDGVKADMDAALKQLLGIERAIRFWEVYEDVREQEGIVDLPKTFDLFGAELDDDALLDKVRAAIMDFPFASRLFPDTLATIAYLHTVGTPVIVSDGDTVYQPRKIEQSGLADAVRGQWVVYAHKENDLDEVMQRWPADFYVMVDDKARILADCKRLQPNRFVTAHILQGHYAKDTYTPSPDVTYHDIGEIRQLDVTNLRQYLTQ